MSNVMELERVQYSTEMHVLDEDDPAGAGTITMTISDVNLTNPIVMIHPPHGGPNPPPYNLDASVILREPNQWLKVRVILTDPHAQFRRDEFCVTAGDRASKGVMRRGAASNARLVEFHVQRSGAVPEPSFSLGLIVPPTGEIYIDPKIENNG